ncbi:Hpt domain-containing protein [bacterium]|nr:Hpt domain-containing protein [bacterium]
MIEQIAETLILMDSANLQDLASLHTSFQQLAKQFEGDDQQVTIQAASKCADLVEKIILGDVESTETALETISNAVSAFQSVISGNRAPEEAGFPQEFDLFDSGESGDIDQTVYCLPAHVDEDIFSEFLAKQPSLLEELEQHILALENAENDKSVAAIKRILHTTKGESGLLGMDDVQSFCHEVEGCFENDSAPSVDALLSAKDWLGRAFEGLRVGECIPGVQDVVEALRSSVLEDGAKMDAPAEQPEQDASATKEPEDETTPETPEPQTTDETSEETPMSLDLELVGEFLIEAREHLEQADLNLLELETDPQNIEAINAVFRAFHTIKGTAAFLNLGDIGKLAHEAESLLNKARSGEILLKGLAVDISLEAVDVLRSLLDDVETAVNNGDSVPHSGSLNALISRIKAAAEGDQGGNEPAPATPTEGTGAKLGEILVNSGALTPGDMANALFEQKTTKKSKKIGELLVKTERVKAKDVVGALRVQKGSGSPSVERPHDQIGRVLVEQGAVSTDDVVEALVEQRAGKAGPKLGEILVKKGRASGEDVAQALQAQKSTVARPVTTVKDVIKVDAMRLDRLVDTIGELVIAEAMVSQSEEVRKGASAEITRKFGQLNKITRELQEMGTSLRMVPVKATFQKMARLVRDLAKKAGKQVELVLSGEDTELDKTVVDKIGDPLVHMVRNAVDHGIEPNAQERLQKGKPSKGRVELRAFHKGGNIHIEIADDGRGLDRDAILAKAKERGLVREGETPSDREIFNLIFEPGFSTAKKVTDISGRGVGMDVVKRNIADLRGNVEISSELGKGSVFSIRLPLTLAIIDGMLLQVGQERYIIPTLSIIGAVKPDPEALQSVLDRGQMLSFQNRLIPVFLLGHLLGIEHAKQDASCGIVIVVEENGKNMGLVVDKLLGLRQTVIKSMSDSLGKQVGVAGATILSDGHVGLILDMGGIMKLINKDEADHLSHLSAVSQLKQQVNRRRT